MTRSYTHTTPYIAAIRRMVRRAGTRVATEDTDTLRDLLTLRDDIEDAIGFAVHGLRKEGFTWESIGEAMGITRQAALMKWRPIVQRIESEKDGHGDSTEGVGRTSHQA